MTSLQKKSLTGISSLLQRSVLSQTVLQNTFFSFPPVFGKNNVAAVTRTLRQTNDPLKIFWAAGSFKKETGAAMRNDGKTH